VKRSGFKMKMPDPQKQLKEALKLHKASFKGNTTGVISGRKCYEDGIRFDSHWEREVYRELKLRQAAGEIAFLETHKTIVFGIKREDGEQKPISINIDFEYYDVNLKEVVRLDAKQPKFRINKRTGTKTNLDNKRKDWLLKWEILKFLQPEFIYEIARQHSGWREYKECSGQKI
jgi:hypothetical protein